MGIWEKKCKDVVNEFIKLGLQDLKGKEVGVYDLEYQILKNESELDSAFGDREKDLMFLKNNWDIACDVYEYMRDNYDIVLNPFEDEGEVAFYTVKYKLKERLLKSDFINKMWDNEIEINDEIINTILNELGIEHEQELGFER